MGRFHVLLVEDNRDYADTLAQFLRHFGFDVRVAYTGPDGVAAALDDPPSAMVCDINLPGLNGFEVANRVRLALPKVPVLIAVTAREEWELIGPAAACGFEHYFRKPADATEIAGLLSDYAVAQPGR